MLAGSFLAFLNAFGGAIQLVGVVGFYAFSGESYTGWSFEAGYFVALLSAIVVCVSIMVPVGPGWSFPARARNPLKTHWHDANTVVQSGENRVAVDGFGIIGACLGIFLVTAIPWTYERPVFDPHRLLDSSIRYIRTDQNLVHYAISQTLGPGPLIMIAAILLMFVSSLAVLLLACGDILFYESATRAASAGELSGIGPGFGLILLSAALAVMAITWGLSGLRSGKLRPSWMIFLTMRVSAGGKV